MKLLATLVISLCISATSFGQADKAAKSIYAADTKKVEARDLNFDWKEFRLSAVQGGTPYFDWHPVRAKFQKQMDQGDTEGALKSAYEIIQHNMAEPEGHLLALVVYQKLGNQEEAAFQHSVVKAYLDSILVSGDGKSSKTAFFVVDEGEEYFYLNIVLHIGLPTSQSLIRQDGHSFDMLKVKDEDGKEREIWFNVDTSMNAMSEALSGGKKK
jgi:hypothetical protein